MPYLRNRSSGAVTDWLEQDSKEYQALVAMRYQASGAIGTGIEAGATPLWEDVPEREAGFPDPAGGRVLVVTIPPSAVGATETVQVTDEELAGALTDVEYVPDAAIPGIATNNRTITLNEVKVTGTAAPARSVTALASITFDATHHNAGGSVPSPLAISQAGFTAAPPDQLEVVSSPNGAGAPDPGGVLYAVYTRA